MIFYHLRYVGPDIPARRVSGVSCNTSITHILVLHQYPNQGGVVGGTIDGFLNPMYEYVI